MAIFNLFQPTVPGVVNNNLGAAYNLGVVFQTSYPANVNGIWFYKSTNDTGTHIGVLWSGTGSNLAQVTFAGETASGWQYMAFGAPVAITPSTNYVASYLCPTGFMSYTLNGWQVATNPFTTKPLSTPANAGRNIANGAVTFPTTASANNYSVDLDLDSAYSFAGLKRSGIGFPRVVGYLRGIYLGGPADWSGNNWYGRYLQTGVEKNITEGTPTAPCLQLSYPGMWRFRWGVLPGTRSVSIWTKQVSNVTGKRPLMIVKANPEIGVNADVTGTAGSSTGWIQIGPVSVVPSSAGALWVELWNKDTDNFNSPAFFDHVVAT